jgi:hypothetical protein
VISRGGLFPSFFLAGFECSAHRRCDRKRLDLIAASSHDRFVRSDYQAVRRFGLHTVRDGLRWHLIEATRGEYDWTSFLPMLRASAEAQVEVLWDLLHYGWPDHIDVWSPDFVKRFGDFSYAVARLLEAHGAQRPFISPINEISFLSWSGADEAWINPFTRKRGFELKCQLVRATIASIDAIRAVLPRARFVQCEPAIHIAADPSRPQDRAAAEGFRLFQFQTLDMLSGRAFRQLGGGPAYVDIVGVNYYNNNQWVHNGRTIWPGDVLYRPFREILREFFERYRCPVLVAETGCEGDDRPHWFRYICGEARAAIGQGVPLEGICLYPVANHPGWDDDRHCPNGLLGYPDSEGRREVFRPLALELARQHGIFAELFGAESQLQVA